jgi:hypothetical protein
LMSSSSFTHPFHFTKRHHLSLYVGKFIDKQVQLLWYSVAPSFSDNMCSISIVLWFWNKLHFFSETSFA